MNKQLEKSTNILSIVFENSDLLIRATHTLYLVMIITGSLLKMFAQRLEISQAWEFTKSINSISEKNIAIHSAGGSRYRFTGAYRDNR